MKNPKKYCTIKPFECKHYRNGGICGWKGYCAEAKIEDTGRDAFGMPVTGDRKLLIPTIELKRFAEHVLVKVGNTLPTLEMGRIYTEYMNKVIKPKYEKK